MGGDVLLGGLKLFGDVSWGSGTCLLWCSDPRVSSESSKIIFIKHSMRFYDGKFM